MKVHVTADIKIPEDFELVMYESKGYFPTVISLSNWDILDVTFYDICRFSQDIEWELKEKIAVWEPNIIFLKKVSRDEIVKAVSFLDQRGDLLWFKKRS